MTRILVIGATSAIAQETIRIWAARGARLQLAARDAARLDAVARDARLRGAAEVETLRFDALDTASHEKIATQAWETWGGLDIVLVAHGVLGDQAASQRDAREAEAQLRTNLLGAVTILTPLASRFEAQGEGVIAAISSVAGDRGRMSNYVYGAAKAGLDAFLEGLRHRLVHAGVAVVTIKPGFVDTPMTAHLRKGPLFASPGRVARGIVRAIDRRRRVAYLPGAWRAVMFLIRNAPSALLHRTRI